MKYQERTKRSAVRIRGARKVLLPNEIKTTPQIICNSCHEPSGFENDDLVSIKPPRNIKCQQCGKVCIQIKINGVSE